MAKYLILKKRKDFLKAAKDITYTLGNVLVQAAFCDENEKSGFPRVGFTATKRIGKAHYRNLTKRRLRAVCRELGRKSFMRDVDYVLVGRYNTAVCPYMKLKEETFEALRRVNGILKKRQRDNEKTLHPSD